jgi:hypothetical protein
MKVLSLDGGGTWALLEAMALENLYGGGTSGRKILAQFDYVVATSGGSIVLGCLLKDWPPAKIVKFFLSEQQRKKIFVARGFGILRPGLARWSTTGKFIGLKELFSSELLSDAAKKILRADGTPLQVIITAYDYDRNRARFFRSNPNSAAASNAISQSVTIAEAVHASSNAPIIYFDEPADLGGIGRFWDGGLTSFDNPVLAGLNEAIANGAKAEEISVLSLGAANAVLPLRGSFPSESDALVRDLPDTHIWTEVKTVMTSILADPPDEATFTAFLMLQHELTAPKNSLRHIRLNPLVQPVLRNGRWEFPDGFRENKILLAPDVMFDRLVKLDMDVVDDEDVKLIYELGRLWTSGAEIPNQPIRPDDELKPQIGFGNFADAKARWLEL